VGGFFVFGGVGGGAVDFEEDEAGRVVGLLDDIEASDAGFLEGVGGVVDADGFEGIDVLGFDVEKNVDDVHGTSWNGEPVGMVVKD
jgi:hypothetical protein